MLLRKTFRFEASHILPRHPGKCSRLHGHSWVLHVEVEGPVNEHTGFVMDYADMSSAVKPLIEELDHKHLGTWDSPLTFFNHWAVESMWGVYPSSENLLFWIGKQLPTLPWTKLALEETCTSYAELSREEFTLATSDQS